MSKLYNSKSLRLINPILLAFSVVACSTNQISSTLLNNNDKNSMSTNFRLNKNFNVKYASGLNPTAYFLTYQDIRNSIKNKTIPDAFFHHHYTTESEIQEHFINKYFGLNVTYPNGKPKVIAVPYNEKTGIVNFDDWSGFDPDLPDIQIPAFADNSNVINGIPYFSKVEDLDFKVMKEHLVPILQGKGLIGNITYSATPKGVEDFLKARNVTMHHSADLKTIQFIPMDLHGVFSHTGGSAIMKAVHRLDNITDKSDSITAYLNAGL